MNPHSVLLVEDSPALQRATSILLEANGYRVHCAATVDEALEHLMRFDCCDLVLLDLDLGDQRGELLYERRHELNRKLPPLIVVSGQPLQECQAAADYTHAMGMVHKPYMPHELIGVIAHALDRAA